MGQYDSQKTTGPCAKDSLAFVASWKEGISLLEHANEALPIFGSQHQKPWHDIAKQQQVNLEATVVSKAFSV